MVSCFLGTPTMAKRTVVCIAFVAVFLCPASVFAVDTSAIDSVRRKTVLNEQDQLTIDTFVGQAVSGLLNTRDFSRIASARVVLTSRSKSQQESAQVQYRPYFFSFANKHIKAALGKIAKMPRTRQTAIVTLNFMILIDDLANTELSGPALDKAQDPDVIIRYWAVHALTNAKIVKQLNSTETSQMSLAEKYVDTLKKVVKNETCPDIISLIAKFGANIKASSATELLEQTADSRIAKYADGTVDNELLDMTVLKSLCDKIQTDKSASTALGRRFAQLYSYVIQRYILDGDSLGQKQKQALVSVIVSSEKLLGRLISGQVGNLERAIEKNKIMALSAEHDSMFGSDSAQGRLPMALGFDYGKKPDGSVRTAPLKLKPLVKTD